MNPHQFKLNLERKKNRINPYKKNLPSATTRPVQPGSDSSGAKSTTSITEDSVPKIVKDMLVLARYRDNKVNEKDLDNIVWNTNALIKQHKNNQSVRKMYIRCQNLWSTFVVNNNIENEYDDLMLVMFFKIIISSYYTNTLWVIYNTGFIDRFGLQLKGLPCLKKYFKKKKQICCKKVCNFNTSRNE